MILYLNIRFNRSIIKILLSVGFLFLFFFSSYSQTISLNAIVNNHGLYNQNMSSAIITIANNKTGETIKYRTVDTIVNNFILEFNNSYIIDFEHKQCYSKTVEINTEAPQIKLNNTYVIELEVSLDKNCDRNSDMPYIIYRPIGRIIFNNSQDKFVYDMDYLFKMRSIYDLRIEKRCANVDEQIKSQHKIDSLIVYAKTDSASSYQIEQERSFLIQLELKNKEQIQAFENECKAKIASILFEKNKKELVEKKDGVIEEKEHTLVESEIKEEKAKFDETKGQIFIYPNHGWASDYSKYIVDPENYINKPIGTYTYDLTKEKKEFYITDVKELKQKFSKEFNHAFVNWDHIYMTNINYKQSHVK